MVVINKHVDQRSNVSCICPCGNVRVLGVGRRFNWLDQANFSIAFAELGQELTSLNGLKPKRPSVGFRPMVSATCTLHSYTLKNILDIGMILELEGNIMTRGTPYFQQANYK